MLRDMGYDEEILNQMTDVECDAEITEIPYNI
jgi:hypothetical protein